MKKVVVWLMVAMMAVSVCGCHVYTMTPECYKRKLYKKSAK